MPDDSPKYPDCTVQLSGTDSNAVAIFRTVRRELINHLVEEKGWTRRDAEKEGDAFQSEATSGDYGHVVVTCFRWVTIT